MKTHASSHAPSITCLIALTALLVGCGPSQMAVTPDFRHLEVFRPDLKREQVCIVSVEDRRADTSSCIGEARLGLFDKTGPYYLAGNLATTMKSMLDTLMGSACTREHYVPVTVTIDTFEVGEHNDLLSQAAYGKFNFHFKYPIDRDTVGSFAISSRPTREGKGDATDEIEPLIYEGVAECVRLFVEGALDKTPGVSHATDTAHMVSLAVAPTRPDRGNAQAIGKDQGRTTALTHHSDDEVAVHCAVGESIVTSLRIMCTWGMHNDSSDYWASLGAGFSYSDIRKTSGALGGNMISLQGRLMKRFFLCTFLYVHVAFAPTVAIESIKTENGVHSSLRLGGQIETLAGLSLYRKLFLEFGWYRLSYDHSQLLPSDHGLIAGLSFIP